MAPRNSFRTRLRNHFREHKEVYQILFILGGTVAVAGGFILSVKVFQGSREQTYESLELDEAELATLTADPEEQSFPQPVGDEMMPLRRIIEFALTAHGGRDKLSRVTSLRRQGSVVLYKEGSDPQTMETSILYRAPDHLRYYYRWDNLEIVAAFDGHDAWQRIKRGEQPAQVEDLDGTGALLMRQDAQTVRPLSEPLSDLSRLEQVEPPADLDRPVYALRHDLGWMIETLYFDRVNLLLRRRDVQMPMPDGATMDVKIEYEDYRYIDDLAMAFFTRVWVDGRVMNEMALDSIEINVGALPLIFERPTTPGGGT